MGDIKYLYVPDAGIRAACGTEICSVLGEISDILRPLDPTTTSDRDGWIRWTAADSKKRGVDHQKLEQIMTAVWKREDNDQQGDFNFPGWSVQQIDKVGALVQNRRLPPSHWCYSGGSSVNAPELQSFNLTIVSPLLMAAGGWCRDTSYTHDAGRRDFALRRGAETLLSIPVAGIDFIDLQTFAIQGEDGRIQRGIDVYVTFPDGTVSHYRLEGSPLRTTRTLEKVDRVDTPSDSK